MAERSLGPCEVEASTLRVVLQKWFVRESAFRTYEG
jgi:hypothetical protein